MNDPRTQRYLALAATMEAGANLLADIARDLRELAGPLAAQEHSLRAVTLREQAKIIRKQANPNHIPPFGAPWRRAQPPKKEAP